MSLICMADSFHMQTTTRRLYLHCAYKHMVSKPLASATNGLPHSQNVANEAQVQIPLPKHLLAASPPQKPGGTWKMQLCNAWDKWLDSDSELPSDHRGPWSENRRMMWSFHVICIDLLSSKECRSWRISSKCSTSISPKTSKCVMDVCWVYPECTILSPGHHAKLYTAQRCSIDCYCTWTHTQISCHTYSCSLWWWHDGIVLNWATTMFEHHKTPLWPGEILEKKISLHKSQERGARYLWFMVLQTPTARN